MAAPWSNFKLRMKSLRPLAAAFLILVSLVLWPFQLLTANPNSSLKEYEIKAAFLYQFTKFVEWPQNVLQDRKEFTICVIGKNPFGQVLNQLESETVHERQVKIQSVEDSSADSCHVVFISASETSNIHKIVGNLRGKSILTVSETPDFLDKGGLINFVKQERNIRFQINKREAEQSGIKISSKLLSLAQRVDS